MPIQPIDLQTLFMRLNQVGKEQAAQREAAHVAQTQQGSEIARRAEEQAHTVNETRDLEYGPEAVEDEEQKSKRESKRGGERGGQREGQGEESKEQPAEQSHGTKKEIFKDPDLGTKIDIIG
ncbi:MAG: hypothetical protein CMN78_04790 [Spirochaetales bacterium]|nr:hypothetical protein [Spirochaetales bacterium]